MMLRAMAVAVLVVGVTGCASLQSSGTAVGPTPENLNAFAHRASSSHLVLYWNCGRSTPDVLRLEGIARNPWFAEEIRDLEFELVGVGARERTVSEVKGEARNTAIRTNQASPFQLDLRTVGGELRFDLFYQYQFAEGEEMDALLAGPPMVPSRFFSPGANRFLVRDVCSESQHLAR